MYLGNTVAVVVPAHNEAPHIRGVLDSLPSLVDRAYVIDDASTDETWSEIRQAVRDRPSGRSVTRSTGTEMGATETAAGAGRADTADAETERGRADRETERGRADAETETGMTDGGTSPGTGRLPEELNVRVPDAEDDPSVVAVRHQENRGRGGAVKTGYRLALADGMDVVAVMDGDGQMDPDDLERIVHPVATDRADYSKGNRLDGPDYWEGMSRWRLFGNVLLTGLTRVASGYWGLRDPQSGFTAISRAMLASLPLEELYDDYGFLNDVLVELNLQDARVADVPIEATYGAEESGIRYGQFVPNLSALLLANFCRRLLVEGGRNRRPWLPGTYAAAGVTWCIALVSVLVAVCSPCAGVLGGGVLSGGAAGILPSAPTLLVAGLLVTAVAVAVDHRQNAPLDRRAKPTVDAR